MLQKNKTNFKDNIEAEEAFKYFSNQYYPIIDINKDILLFSRLLTEPAMVEQLIETYLNRDL